MKRAEAKIAEAHANYQHEPLIIRPSAQWYVCEEESLESENKGKEDVRKLYETCLVSGMSVSLYTHQGKN